MSIQRALAAYRAVQESLYLKDQQNLAKAITQRLGENVELVKKGIDDLPTVQLGELYFCQQQYGDRDVAVYALVDLRLRYLKAIPESEISWVRLGKMLVDDGIK